jgi:hypothetical protein
LKENQNLKLQVEDLKMTLSINKDLLFKYISQQNKASQEKQIKRDIPSNSNNTNIVTPTTSATNLTVFTEIEEENNRLTQKINKLFEEKTLIEKKVNLIIKI